jgi:hypothetical protein
MRRDLPAALVLRSASATMTVMFAIGQPDIGVTMTTEWPGDQRTGERYGVHAEQISGLLHEAGETHRRVFRIVDGADDWAA